MGTVNKMTDFLKARAIVTRHAKTSVPKTIFLSAAAGYVLAESIKVKADAPPFDQSAMDGFAFNYKNWDKTSPLKISGEVPAGRIYNRTLPADAAVRIYTGAAVPSGADTVVIKENVIEENNCIRIRDIALKPGANIRKKGSHIKAGYIACRKEQYLSAGSIAFLASVGVAKVKVYSKPAVGIIVTGNELTKPGLALKKGHVYECNSYGLSAALTKMQIVPKVVVQCNDEQKKLESAIRKVLKVSDIVILTGGVSAGDYDLVASALTNCGVKKKFHKVAQKPGKPLYFGVQGTKLVFGLPGNPAAVLSCFYTFIVDAISNFTKVKYDSRVMLPSINSYVKKGSLTHILKARTHAHGVEILGDQESYKLSSLAIADALVLLPPEKLEVRPGDLLEVRLLNK